MSSAEVNSDIAHEKQLPCGWINKKVSEFTVEHKQGYYTKDSYTGFGSYLIRITDLNNPKINYSEMPKLVVDEKEFNQFKVEIGDFLFARSGAIGRYGIVTEDFPSVFASYLIRFRFNQEVVSTRYFGYAYESDICQKQLGAITQGSSNININADNIKSLLIPYPPLPEQQKIAKILTSVDEVIEKTQAQIDKLKDLKTGMMQELLTNGIGHTEFKDSAFGRIPAEWAVKTLLEVCSSKYAIVDGPFGSNLKTEHYRSSGIPVFQSGFVTSNKFVEKKYVYVDQSKYDEQKRSSAKAGDILMAKIGMNAGACAIIPSNHTVGILAGNSLKITVDSNVVLSEFILGIIHSMQNTGEIRRLLTETAQPAISITTLKKMNVPIPSVEEQKMIVTTFNSIDKKIDIETDRLNSRNQLKKALMQDLLTGKVRVKVDS